MKKLNLFCIIAVLLMTSGKLFSQAVDRLYMSLQATGRIYDITALSATPATAIALPTALATPNFSATPNNASNLAVGYDVQGGNPNSLVFLQSNIAASSAIYKNGTIINGTTLPAGTTIGGIATNNVPGTYLGNTYGFGSNTKTLYPIYPSGAAITITGDADWTNGTTIGTDTFYDYQNNIYMFLDRTVGTVTTRYLYKISPSGVATKVVAVTGTAGTVATIQGMAYLQGYVYIATVNNPNSITIRRINIFDGTSIVAATYTGGNFQNLDLGTVPYYIPFEFTCGSITQTSNVPFVAGVPSNSQKFINIPITNVYEDGTYTINVTGTDFTNPAYQAAITRTTTSIQVPLIYNGTGSGGIRTLTVNLNGSSTACSVNVQVDDDTDGDGIGNSQDLDDDNDGILDTVEDACEVEGTPVYSNTFGTGGRTSDPNVLNHTYTTNTAISDGFYGVTTSAGTSETFNQTDLIGGLDAGNPIIGTGTTTGRYLAINIGSDLLYQPIYRVSGLATTPGTRYRFRIDMAGLANGAADIPNLQISVKDSNGNILASAGSTALGIANDDVWRRLSLNFVASTANVVLEIINYQPSGTAGNDLGIDNIVLTPLTRCDTDGDGIPNSLDVDSDNDGCADAIEGSETVKFDQVHSLALPSTDANYAYRGQIKTVFNGVTAGTPAQIISTSTTSYGVPQLVNNAGNNLNSATNPSNLAGIADNTDGTSDIGQGIGDSQNASINSCICYKPTVTSGTVLDTNQGITSMQRAGSIGSNWPMVRKGAWTALESNTKGFVPNRLTTAQIAAIPTTSLIEGMMVYNITLDCLQINTDGTASGWKCFNTQTCSDIN